MGERLCPIAHQASLFPNKPALITLDRHWTYSECDSAVRGLCLHLKELGIASQSRVAFYARTHPTTVFLLFALFRLGAIACPLSFREPAEKLPQLTCELGATHYLALEKLCLNASVTSQFSHVDEENEATFLFTSGSSNAPKIACHTLGNHLSNALGTLDKLSLGPWSRWLLSLPLFHVGGLAILFRMFLSSGAVVLSDLSLFESISRFHITHVSVVPTQLIRLLREKNLEGHLQSLQCLLLGGAPLSLGIIQQAIRHQIPLFTTYGMTEMSSIITVAHMQLTDHIAHAGKALAFRQVKLSPCNEILVRGDPLFKGYWDPIDKEIKDARIDGWLPTRDLGVLTPNGDLCVLGRMDRLFISGGENMHPEEIERALCAIPGIISATVVPIEDTEFGQRPIAFIHDETAQHTLESIREALKPLLPAFKHPIQILPYPDKDTTLKMNYRYLREYVQIKK